MDAPARPPAGDGGHSQKILAGQRVAQGQLRGLARAEQKMDYRLFAGRCACPFGVAAKALGQPFRPGQGQQHSGGILILQGSVENLLPDVQHMGQTLCLSPQARFLRRLRATAEPVQTAAQIAPHAAGMLA